MDSRRKSLCLIYGNRIGGYSRRSIHILDIFRYISKKVVDVIEGYGFDLICSISAECLEHFLAGYSKIYQHLDDGTEFVTIDWIRIDDEINSLVMDITARFLVFYFYHDSSDEDTHRETESFWFASKFSYLRF
jgi:hypothetical protein